MSTEETAVSETTNQATKKKPIFKKWWFWVIIVVVILAIGGAASGGNGNSSSQTNATNTAATASEKQASNVAKEPDPRENDVAYQASKKKFETVAEMEMHDSYGYPVVTGTIKNISGKKLSYAQIEFNFYDGDGAQIGSTLTNINNLEADGIWKYEAHGFDKGAATVKMVEITGY